MAAVAAPKICRERERKGREGRKEREKRRNKRETERGRGRGEKGKKGSGDQERNMYYAYMGVKHPLRTVNRLLTWLKSRKEGGWKKLKKQEERKRRQKWLVKIWWHRQRTDWDVRIKDLHFTQKLNHIYHSCTLRQFYSSCQKRDYHLNGDPFFGMLSKNMHQITQIRFENGKVFIMFIASEGAHPLRHPLFKQGRFVKCYWYTVIQTVFCMLQ